MASQAIWIGIAVGVFFAGLGIGYTVLQSSTPTPPMMMNQQQMQQMMNNPQTMNQWMDTMMSDPQLRQQMYSQMMPNNQFMQGMMENQQFQNQWMSPGMGQGMMGSGMMGQGMMNAMQDPEFREKISEQMLEHQQLMQEMMSADWNDPAINKQWQQRFEEHQKFMQELHASQLMTQATPTITSKVAITENELMSQLSDESVLLLDIREIEQFDQGHIQGAATATCAEDKREKVLARIPKSIKIILVDQDGTQAPEMVQLILDAGLNAQYLEGGMNNWEGSLVKDPGAVQITPDELWNRIEQNDDLFLLDVRTPMEFMNYHIPNSVNIPLEYTFDEETVSILPDEKDIIVICKSGTRATVASFALAKQGIAGEILEGGVDAWLDYINNKS